MSEAKKVWYCVDDSAPENGHEFTVNDRPPYDWGYIAQECAEDYFHNCDGWEDSWPKMVYLRETEDGQIVATFEVHMEAEPQFYAYEPMNQGRCPMTEAGAVKDPERCPRRTD